MKVIEIDGYQVRRRKPEQLANEMQAYRKSIEATTNAYLSEPDQTKAKAVMGAYLATQGYLNSLCGSNPKQVESITQIRKECEQLFYVCFDKMVELYRIPEKDLGAIATVIGYKL